MLVSDADLIKELAKKLRKRVVIRPDAAIIMPEDQAVEMIKQLVPAEAEITDITFDPGISEVIIEAKKPGLAIGKSGSTLREITKNVRWAPRIVRTPPITSTIVQGIRSTLAVRAMRQAQDEIGWHGSTVTGMCGPTDTDYRSWRIQEVGALPPRFDN